MHIYFYIIYATIGCYKLSGGKYDNMLCKESFSTSKSKKNRRSNSICNSNQFSRLSISH